MLNFELVTNEIQHYQNMQQNKGIKNLQETTKYSVDSLILLKTFAEILKEFDLSYINKILSKSKSKGIAPKNIFQILFTFCFVDLDNIRQLMLSGYSKFMDIKKDAYYEFLNNERIDWRKILHLFAKQHQKIVLQKADKEQANSPKCLIVDDTDLPKSGKKIEFMGKVFNHCSHSYNLGMKVLTVGFWDGKSYVPLDFSVHNEPGKNNKRGLREKDLKKQYSKQRESDTPGFARAQDMANDKIQMAIQMIKSSVKKSFEPLYVLADSWFISETFITEIQNIETKSRNNIHVIGIMKSNRIFTINNKQYKASTIPEIKRKNVKYCRKLKCHYIKLLVEYKGIEMTAFWVKMKGQESWKALITTDLTLSFIKTMEYYQIRWVIEVFFKECKQNLGLNKCQSTDFDAHIASISICFMNYIVLSLRKRFDDYETLGELFRAFKNQLLEITLVEKIWQLLIEMLCSVLAELGIDWELFIEKFIRNEKQVQLQIKNTLEFMFENKNMAA